MHELDANGDGQISYEEFEKVMVEFLRGSQMAATVGGEGMQRFLRNFASELMGSGGGGSAGEIDAALQACISTEAALPAPFDVEAAALLNPISTGLVRHTTWTAPTTATGTAASSGGAGSEEDAALVHKEQGTLRVIKHLTTAVSMCRQLPSFVSSVRAPANVLHLRSALTALRRILTARDVLHADSFAGWHRRWVTAAYEQFVQPVDGVVIIPVLAELLDNEKLKSLNAGFAATAHATAAYDAAVKQGYDPCGGTVQTLQAPDAATLAAIRAGQKRARQAGDADSDSDEDESRKKWREQERVAASSKVVSVPAFVGAITIEDRHQIRGDIFQICALVAAGPRLSHIHKRTSVATTSARQTMMRHGIVHRATEALFQPEVAVRNSAALLLAALASGSETDGGRRALVNAKIGTGADRVFLIQRILQLIKADHVHADWVARSEPLVFLLAVLYGYGVSGYEPGLGNKWLQADAPECGVPVLAMCHQFLTKDMPANSGAMLHTKAGGYLIMYLVHILGTVLPVVDAKAQWSKVEELLDGIGKAVTATVRGLAAAAAAAEAQAPGKRALHAALTIACLRALTAMATTVHVVDASVPLTAAQAAARKVSWPESLPKDATHTARIPLRIAEFLAEFKPVPATLHVALSLKGAEFTQLRAAALDLTAALVPADPLPFVRHATFLPDVCALLEEPLHRNDAAGVLLKLCEHGELGAYVSKLNEESVMSSLLQVLKASAYPSDLVTIPIRADTAGSKVLATQALASYDFPFMYKLARSLHLVFGASAKAANAPSRPRADSLTTTASPARAGAAATTSARVLAALESEEIAARKARLAALACSIVPVLQDVLGSIFDDTLQAAHLHKAAWDKLSVADRTKLEGPHDAPIGRVAPERYLLNRGTRAFLNDIRLFNSPGASAAPPPAPGPAMGGGGGAAAMAAAAPAVEVLSPKLDTLLQEARVVVNDWITALRIIFNSLDTDAWRTDPTVQRVLQAPSNVFFKAAAARLSSAGSGAADSAWTGVGGRAKASGGGIAPFAGLRARAGIFPAIPARHAVANNNATTAQVFGGLPAQEDTAAAADDAAPAAAAAATVAPGLPHPGALHILMLARVNTAMNDTDADGDVAVGEGDEDDAQYEPAETVEQVAGRLEPFTRAQMEQLRTTFVSLQDSAGQLAVTPFISLMKTIGVNLSDERYRQIFDLLDRDKSGKLEPHELVVGLTIMMKGSPDDRLKLAFDSFDTDHSGSIEPAELQAMVLTATGKSPAECRAMVQRIFAHADTDNNGSLSFEELMQARMHPDVAAILQPFVKQ